MQAFFKMKFSQKEIQDLVKAWVMISLAFAIVMAGFSFSTKFITAVFVSALTVGVGFLLHELGHKLIAQKYHCKAEFRSFDQMLVLALAMSFFGFIFAAPGAVMIHGHLTRSQYGKVSAAGPLTNFIVALLFLPLAFSQIPLAATAGFYGATINSWLGIFNLIPFGNFDGRKIFNWNKFAYGALVAAGFAIMFVLQH